MFISKKELKETQERQEKRMEEIENTVGEPEHKDINSWTFDVFTVEATGLFKKIEGLEKHLGIEWVKEDKSFEGYRKAKNKPEGKK